MCDFSGGFIRNLLGWVMFWMLLGGLLALGGSLGWTHSQPKLTICCDATQLLDKTKYCLVTLYYHNISELKVTTKL